MIYVLSHLNNCLPSMRSELFLTIITLHVAFNKFGDESLFYFGFVIELLLNGNFNFYSF